MDKTLQRMAGLDAANEIRSRRAQLRKELHASKVASRRRAAELLHDLPDWLHSCRVENFLKLFPGIGRVRAKVVMSRLEIRESATLALLSPQRRAELAIHIAQTGAP